VTEMGTKLYITNNMRALKYKGRGPEEVWTEAMPRGIGTPKNNLVCEQCV